MFRSLLIIALYLCTSSTQIAAAGEPAESLIWFGPDWKPAWTVDLEAGALQTESAEDLFIPLGSKKVPDLEVELISGGSFSYSAENGNVLLVDFWASWCVPCLVELPHLQNLHDSEKDNGLAVLAVNIADTEKVASETAARIGLRVPIALLNDEIDRFFEPKSLPTLVLADRRGMIRKRWNGYETGLEREIASTARRLLGVSAREQQEKYGFVHQGVALFRVRWATKFETEIEGLAVAARDDGSLLIHISTDRTIATMRADGEHGGTIKVPPGMNRLLSADVTGDGLQDLVGYRSDNARVGVIDMKTGRASGWFAPGRCRMRLSFLPRTVKRR